MSTYLLAGGLAVLVELAEFQAAKEQLDGRGTI